MTISEQKHIPEYIWIREHQKMSVYLTQIIKHAELGTHQRKRLDIR